MLQCCRDRQIADEIVSRVLVLCRRAPRFTPHAACDAFRLDSVMRLAFGALNARYAVVDMLTSQYLLVLREELSEAWLDTH